MTILMNIKIFRDWHYGNKDIRWEDCFTTSGVPLDTVMRIFDKWITLCDTYRDTLYVKS